MFDSKPASPAAGSGLLITAIDEFLRAAEDGSARDRYGRPFSPEAVHELHWCLSGYVGEELGGMRLSDVRRPDLEALLYELSESRLSPRRLRAVAKSVRALYDYAIERGLVDSNPAERLALPHEEEAEQPTRRAERRADRQPRLALPHAARFPRQSAERAISLVLQISTLALLVIALVLIAESL